MPHRRALLLMSSITAVFVGLFAVRSSLAEQGTRQLSTTTPTQIVVGLPQQFMPLGFHAAGASPASTCGSSHAGLPEWRRSRRPQCGH
jgi:hypothetical protein